MVNDIAAIGALIVSAITAIITWIRVRSDVEKDEVDGAATISEASLNLLNPLRERVETLEREARERDKEIARLWDWIDELFNGARKLYEQVRGLGAEPVYTPRRPERKQD